MSTQISLAGALLPAGLYKALEPKLEDTLFPQKAIERAEDRMRASAQLIINLVLETAKVFETGQLKKESDPNPGDGGCQLRAVIQYGHYYSPAVRTEALALKKEAEAAKKALQQRNQKPGNESSTAFFNRCIETLVVSPEMLYQLRCHLLTVTKVKDHITEDGVLVTKTDFGRLVVLSPKADKIDDISRPFRKAIVDNAAIDLARESIARLNIPKELIMGTKPIACLLPSMKACLKMLKEANAPVVFKSIVKEGKPFYLHFAATQGKLVRVPAGKLDPSAALIVVEGVTKLKEEELAKLIDEAGFEELLLACSASEAPFNGKTTLDDVKVPEVRKEIEAYRQFAEKLGCAKDKNPVVYIDHVFCNTVKAEAI